MPERDQVHRCLPREINYGDARPRYCSHILKSESAAGVSVADTWSSHPEIRVASRNSAETIPAPGMGEGNSDSRSHAVRMRFPAIRPRSTPLREYSRSRLRSAIPLAAILEPIGHLSQRQAGLLREVLLIVRRGVSVSHVAFLQGVPRAFLEAVHGLLAVPDRLRQRVLLAQAVLVDGAERPAADLLRLAVMRLEPHLLEFRVAARRERMTLQDRVELMVGPPVEGNGRSRYQHALAAPQQLPGRQGPKKSGANGKGSL